jgi:hypothetical protein
MNGGQKVKQAIVDAVSTLPGEDGFSSSVCGRMAGSAEAAR